MRQEIINDLYHQLCDIESELQSLVMNENNNNLENALGDISNALMALTQETSL